MQLKKWHKEAILLFLVVTSIFLPRINRFDSSATIDEPDWVRRSANYYYHLWQRDFENLIYEYHPAVTTLWVGTAGMVFSFSGHREYGQEFVKYRLFSEYLESYNKTSFDIFKAMRFVNIVVNSILLTILFYLLRHLFTLHHAIVITFMIAFDPFHFGHTRILAHEGMMVLFLLISILFAMLYLYRYSNTWFLLFSGAAAGFAMLTKSSGTMIFLFVGLLFLLEFIWPYQYIEREDSPSYWSRMRSHLGNYFLWFLGMIGTYILFWPGMWVSPFKMLSFVYGSAANYVVTGHKDGIEAVAQLPFIENAVVRMASFFETLFFHTTPVVWLGLILLVVCLPRWIRQDRVNLDRQVTRDFFLFAFFFLLMMGIVRGRDSDHYIMAVFVSLDVLAGLGFMEAGKRALHYVKPDRRQYFIIVPMVVLAVVQLSQWSANRPYYYNYCNPLIEMNGFASCEQVVGYGMGLDQAAVYLAAMPDAENMQVMSWAGIGPFSYFFPGEVVPLSPGIKWDQQRVDALHESDYLVIYPVVQLGKNEPKELLAALIGVVPDHVIWIDGIEYIWIYKVSELPEAVFVPGNYD